MEQHIQTFNKQILKSLLATTTSWPTPKQYPSQWILKFHATEHQRYNTLWPMQNMDIYLSKLFNKIYICWLPLSYFINHT